MSDPKEHKEEPKKEKDEEPKDGEEVEVPAAPLLDFSALQTEASERLTAMKANPDRRGDPDLTYSAFADGSLHGRDQALSFALRQAAEVWLAKSEKSGIGAIAKKKLLAQKVLNGDFDVK